MNTREQEILAARAAELARPIVNRANSGVVRYVIAVAAASRYGIPAGLAHGLVVVGHVALLPGVPAHVGGLIAFRGAPLPAFHIEGLLGRRPSALTERTQALVMGARQPELAVLIEHTFDVINVRLDALLPAPPSLAAGGRQLVSGVMEDGTVMFDGPLLLESERLTLGSHQGDSS